MKILYQFQEYVKILSKKMTDQYTPRDWLYAFRKLPQLFANETPNKPFQPSLSTIPEVSESQQKTEEKIEVPKSEPKPPIEAKESSYIPLIGGWKQKNVQIEPPKQDNTVPKWRTTVPASSSVCYSISSSSKDLETLK